MWVIDAGGGGRAHAQRMVLGLVGLVVETQTGLKFSLHTCYNSIIHRFAMRALGIGACAHGKSVIALGTLSILMDASASTIDHPIE